jgi:hypothetical protein
MQRDLIILSAIPDRECLQSFTPQVDSHFLELDNPWEPVGIIYRSSYTSPWEYATSAHDSRKTNLGTSLAKTIELLWQWYLQELESDEEWRINYGLMPRNHDLDQITLQETKAWQALDGNWRLC